MPDAPQPPSGMTPDDVANFETFPEAPSTPTMDIDHVANFHTFTDAPRGESPFPSNDGNPILPDGDDRVRPDLDLTKHQWEQGLQYSAEQRRIEARIEELAQSGEFLRPNEIFDLERLNPWDWPELEPILGQIPVEDLGKWIDSMASTYAINQPLQGQFPSSSQFINFENMFFRALGEYGRRAGHPHPVEVARMESSRAAFERESMMRMAGTRVGDPDPETVARLERMDFSGIFRAMGQQPVMAIGMVGVVALLVLGLVAGLGRGGATSQASTVPGATAAAKGGAPGAWMGCSAAPVTDAQAIPKNTRMLVSVYCFGDHYYPVEQFTFTGAPQCGTGAESYLVTKTGQPAIPIDAPGVKLPNPRPNACGYLRMSEVQAASDEVVKRMPVDQGMRMYPIAVEAYNAWKAAALAGPGASR